MKRVLVLSAKGGVGKTSVSTWVARSMAKKARVGLADMDLLNPNLGEVLGVRRHDLRLTAEKILPADIDGMKVMTLEFLPEEDRASLWKGRMTADLAKQLLETVDWGDTEYLIVDCPPGTGDVTMTLLGILSKEDCAVVVTGPRPTEVTDAVRTLDALHHFKTRIAGLVVNFSTLRCGCGKVYGIGAPAEEIAKRLGLQLLATIPLCVDGGERPESFIDPDKFLGATKRKFSLFGGR